MALVNTNYVIFDTMKVWKKKKLQNKVYGKLNKIIEEKKTILLVETEKENVEIKKRSVQLNIVLFMWLNRINSCAINVYWKNKTSFNPNLRLKFPKRMI